MPKYNADHMKEFMKRARWSNDHFEKWKNSSLHALIAVLNSDDGSALKVQTALLTIPQGKIVKYKDAFYYLLQTYPGLPSGSVGWGALKETNAALFPKVDVPRTYNPRSRVASERIVKGTPPTAFLGQTCESFLLNNANASNGVILIHLDHHHAPMDTMYNGYKVVDHINSVLRVARLTNADLCVLHMAADQPVSDKLSDSVDLFDNPTIVFRGTGHMGSVDSRFRDFAAAHTNCIVMGFDGTICVHANIFGAPEYTDREETRPARPLITLTNVITSRAVLVTSGALYPKNWQQEYGVLEGTG